MSPLLLALVSAPGEDPVDEVRRDLVHPPPRARGAKTPLLAGVADGRVKAALGTAHPDEPSGKHPAVEEALERALHVAGKAAAVGPGEKWVEILADHLVEKGGFGSAAAVGVGHHEQANANAVAIGPSLEGRVSDHRPRYFP
ncbi:MAG TPA: hypothetical protein VE981_09805 [Planctomycetota bacterium]|nr:hypothetical protein [Planctomycetota bacterium]